MNAVLHTVILVLTVEYGSVLLVRNLLEGFGAAMVAGVGIDEEEWLHFRYTSDDAANSDEFA